MTFMSMIVDDRRASPRIAARSIRERDDGGAWGPGSPARRSGIRLAVSTIRLAAFQRLSLRACDTLAACTPRSQRSPSSSR
jgi:hypothetical protein